MPQASWPAMPTPYGNPPTLPPPDEAKRSSPKWIVPIATTSALLSSDAGRTFTQKLVSQSQWQAQKLPDWLLSLSNADEWMSQQIATNLPNVAQKVGQLGQQPTLAQLAGLNEAVPDWADVKASRGGAWWRHTKATVQGSLLANQANTHTYGLTPTQLLLQPKHWGKALKVGGKALNASFTRPFGVFFSTGQQAFNAGLSTLALGSMAYSIGAAGLRANTAARRVEDGSNDSKWHTFKETTGTLAHRTLKSGAIWLAGSAGFLLSHAAFKASGLGAFANLPKLVVGMVGGATLGTVTSTVLDTVSPNKY